MRTFFSFKSGRSTPTSNSTPIQSASPASNSSEFGSSPQADRNPPSSFKFSSPSPIRSNDLKKTPSASLLRKNSSGKTDFTPTSVKSPAKARRPSDASFPSGPPPTIPLPPTPVDTPEEKRKSRIVQPINVSPNRRYQQRMAGFGTPPSSYGSRVHTHGRAASTTSSPLSGSASLTNSTTGRQRSSTVNALSSEPPTTPTRPSRSTEMVQSETPKHRPVALRLRTSNLTPSPSRQISPKPRTHVRYQSPTKNTGKQPQMLGQRAGSDDSNHTVRPSSPPQSFPLRRTESAAVLPTREQFIERRRSSSTGDALLGLGEKQLAELRALQTPQYIRLTHRRSHSAQSKSSLLTTTSTISTPSLGTPRRGFESLPLPWSTETAPALRLSLGNSTFHKYLDTTLSSLALSTPRLLAPESLRTSISEEGRLRSEMERLKEKYDKLLLQRDKMAVLLQEGTRGDRNALATVVEAMVKITARCDRVARQVFICNDQIRQIELQGEEHIVGTLLLALRQRTADSSIDSSDPHSPTRPRTRKPKLSAKPQVEPSVLKTGESSSNNLSVEVEECLSPDSALSGTSSYSAYSDLSDPTPTTDIVILQPMKDQPGLKIADSRRTSTATLFSVNNFGFPVPPHRQDSDEISSSLEYPPSSEYLHETNQPIQSGHSGETTMWLDEEEEKKRNKERDTIAAFVRNYTSPARSEFGISSDYHGEDGIPILPPSHQLNWGEETGMPLSAKMPMTPAVMSQGNLSEQRSFVEREEYLSTRDRMYHEGKKDKQVEDKRASFRQFRNSLKEKNVGEKERKVAPLKIKTKGRKGRGGSMILRSDRSGKEEGMRSRRGRDTQLETPESILLSLATAEFWTKHGFGNSPNTTDSSDYSYSR
ncbi:hypothetical protein M231_01539 [Tremella mesenterica]|uniref:Uncharacterized protein n=1 Tax=Tremella mesenterica TaxID=5217 RepID=A0A4Q1BT17_TREME|nr:hypothetical protein M231_01539 [Tremella mesenterica]